MKKLSLIALLSLLAVLVMAVAASARGGDRNGDRIPDRWERSHRLSLKVNQARRDTDRDGLNNRGEWRSHSDPRDRDSDDDGIKDGAENAGTVASFTNGVLTINLAQAGGGQLSATVDDDTEIECHTRADLRHRAHRSSGSDDNSGPGDAEGRGDEHGDDEHGDDEHGDHEHGDHEHGDDDDGDDANEHGGDDDDRCGADQLKVGTVVHEAELEVTSKGKHWEELELIPAA